MKRNLEWYRSHDSLTNIKLKNQMSRDTDHFIDCQVAVIDIHLRDLAHFYDVSGSSYGDQIISELARLISCFFDENYIYRDGYNGFLVITDYTDYVTRLQRLKTNCAQYTIRDYLVFTTLEYSVSSGYVKDAQSLHELINTSQHLAKKSDDHVLEDSSVQGDLARDEQTGLLNIDTFRHECEKVLNGHDLLKGHFVFIHLDVRNFHLFNERFGHAASQRMIQAVADLLKDQFDDSLICHITIDRFAILTKEQGIEERLSQLAESFDLYYDLEYVYLIAGLYRVNEKVSAIEGVERARQACISIKEKDEKRYSYFDEEIRRVLLKEKFIIENLKTAIEKGDLEIYYQPVMRTMSEETAGYEAISRWHQGKNSVMMPEEYVPVLERHHMIHILDTWMIEQAAKDLARRRYNKETILPCSVNISLHDFELCDLIDVLNKQTALYQIPRNFLAIEIRNYHHADQDSFIIEQLRRLHYLGYRIFLDHSGEAVLPAHLIDVLSVDGYKIDIGGLGDFNRTSKLMLRSIVSLAKEMGLMTTIMGIENDEQAHFVKMISPTYVQGRYFGDVLPFEKLQKQEISRHMILETSAERNYQDALSVVDLGKMPVSEETERELPVAIVELNERRTHFALANEAFRRFCRQIGFHDVNSLEQMINVKPSMFVSPMIPLIEKTQSSDTTEPFEAVVHNFQIKMNMRYLKSTEDKKAYMVSVESFKPIGSNQSMVSPVLQYFYKRYEMIYLLSPLSSQAECLYKSDEVGLTKDASFDEMMKQSIYPDDYSKLQKFCDGQQLINGIYSSSQHRIREKISLRNAAGNYHTHLFEASLASDESEPLILLTVTFCSDEEASGPETKTVSYDKGALWDNMVNQLHIGIFWKDINRRFVGANETFMKYYGFSSVDEFKGKTDEDIGWHVSPDAFAMDEEDVLKNGVSKINRQGTCIVNGMVHPIAAFKMPIYNDGRIAGLMGFFKDLTDDRLQKDHHHGFLDEVTGSSNAMGVSVSIEQYINEYKDNHRDFVVMAISLDNMQEMTDENGLDFTHHALKMISDVIHDQMGNDCVIGHVMGDVFVVVHQNDDEVLTRRILSNVTNAIHDIVSIDNQPFTPYLSSVYQYYSKVDNHYDILDLTLKKLVLMREAHRIATSENYKKNSINLYKTIAKTYDPVFSHIVLMDEKMKILYSQHMNQDVHDYLSEGDHSLVMMALNTKNTYSDVEKIGDSTYYCVVSYENLEGLHLIIEAAKRVDL